MGRKLIVSIITMILTISLVGCKKEESSKPIKRTEIFMGTPINISLYSGGDTEILKKAFDKVVEIENLVSVNKDGTELDTLNKSAGISSVKLSDISYDIVKKGLEYSKLSDGGYDVSVGPLVKLWSIGLEGAKVPTEEEIKEVIKLVDYSKVEINDETKEVFLKDKGMTLDLGSIAKGYTADELVTLLKKEGVSEAIIDLGGNIYALGKKEGNKEYKIHLAAEVV